MRKIVTSALALLFTLGLTGQATAGTVSGRDPQGDSGDKAIDVVSYSLQLEAEKLVVQVRLAAAVPRGEQAYLQVDLDTDGDKKPDAVLSSTSPWKVGQVKTFDGRALCKATMESSASTANATIPGACIRHPLTVGANIELIGGENERAWDRVNSVGKPAIRDLEKGTLKALPDRKGTRVTYSVDPYFSGKTVVLTSVAKRGQKAQVLTTGKIGQGGEGFLTVSKKIPPRAMLTLSVGGAKAASGRR